MLFYCGPSRFSLSIFILKRLGKTYLKSTDDWEADDLNERQINYAAADGAAGLDIFYALMSEKELGTFSPTKFVLNPETSIKSQLTDLR